MAQSSSSSSLKEVDSGMSTRRTPTMTMMMDSSKDKVADTDTATATDTDSEGYTKKATLIALVSLGVTLLITGATSRRLLQKPPSAGTAVTTSTSTPTAVQRRMLGTGMSHQASTPPRRPSSQLRALFASADPANTTDKLDFRANQHTGFAQQIPIFAASPAAIATIAPSSSPASPSGTEQPDSADPTMDAMLDAVKAFGIATALLLGTTGFGAFLIARKVGATDFDSFFYSLRHEIMHPITQKLEPNLPDWLRQRQRDPDEIANDEREEYEVTHALRQEWREFVQEATDEERRKNGKDLIVKAS